MHFDTHFYYCLSQRQKYKCEFQQFYLTFEKKYGRKSFVIEYHSCVTKFRSIAVLTEIRYASGAFHSKVWKLDCWKFIIQLTIIQCLKFDRLFVIHYLVSKRETDVEIIDNKTKYYHESPECSLKNGPQFRLTYFQRSMVIGKNFVFCFFFWTFDLPFSHQTLHSLDKNSTQSRVYGNHQMFIEKQQTILFFFISELKFFQHFHILKQFRFNES